MNRRIFNRIGLTLFAMSSADASMAADSETKHKLALQVSSDDQKVQELTLANARHYASYYKSKNESFKIEIVAFGPGYSMLRDDASAVKQPIETLMADLRGAIVFAACQNTRKAIAKSSGKTTDQIPEIKGVTEAQSGVVRLAELQQQGWSYVKP